jgi:hypothetical protein
MVLGQAVVVLGYLRHCFHFLNLHQRSVQHLGCNRLGKYLGKHLELYTKFRYRKFHKNLRSCCKYCNQRLEVEVAAVEFHHYKQKFHRMK